MTRSRRSALVVVALILAATAGCNAHFSGSVAIDGIAFVPVGCRSEQAYGYGHGVELSDVAGQRLRLATSLEGNAVAALFQPGMAHGQFLGACGVIAMEAQGSKINGVRNVRGVATLACKASGHDVSGQIQFENCH
jgi:hypothetical protein